MFIFRIFSLILILKCLVDLTLSELHNTSPEVRINDTKPEMINLTNFKTITQSDNNKINMTIIGEGGEKLKPENSQSTVTPTTERADNVTLASVDRTYGREGEGVENNKQVELLNVTTGTTSVSATTENLPSDVVKPVFEAPLTEKAVVINAQPTRSPHSRIVPKKGVNFNDTVSKPTDISTTAFENSSLVVTKAISVTTTSATTTTTEAMKQIYKPTVTIGSDDMNDTLTKERSNQPIPKVPTIEYYQKKEEDNKRSTFIIPIVAVILSVPLVAIVMNILYKRCKEWWSHRHYSRMDFLIDGMYNN